MVMGALVNFMPEQVMACSQGTSAILTLGGVDPRSGRHYVSYETMKGGFGARPNKDGINCIASGISNTMNTPGGSLGDGVPGARRALRGQSELRAAPAAIVAAAAPNASGACWRAPMRRARCA